VALLPVAGDEEDGSLLRRAIACFAVLVTASSCGLFTLKEPYERWNVVIAYHEDDGVVTVDPTRVEVHGPRGELRIDNTTRVERGFQIEELGIAIELDDSDSNKVDITGAQDGETYAFRDHLNRDGPKGEIVVDYVAQN
jgi:hypothetical protein